jgi:hypothetical protein
VFAAIPVKVKEVPEVYVTLGLNALAAVNSAVVQA